MTVGVVEPSDTQRVYMVFMVKVEIILDKHTSADAWFARHCSAVLNSLSSYKTYCAVGFSKV